MRKIVLQSCRSTLDGMRDLLHATMPVETTKDASAHSLAADQEDAVVKRAGAVQRAVAKVRRYAWLAFAVAREIVAWAWDVSWETLSRIRKSKRAMTVLMGI